HDGTNFDFAVDDPGTLYDVVETQDAALRWVHDRCREHRSINSAVGDREGPTLKLFKLDRVLLGACPEIEDRLLHLRKAQAVRITNDGHDQALTTTHGNADIV